MTSEKETEETENTLKSLADSGRIVRDEVVMTTNTIFIPSTSTYRFDGEAHFEENSEEPGHYHFDVHLGPANSRKLVEFLLTLGPEPKDEE